ncbi:unnamed protein product [Lactuca saligna]|uniref:Uncharacterized protein n=1 Tax=Lactuca saligna TaxID=75948 RepID=A0AA35V775_LACSI|nr:unnamed protein product [Lactuca saligna]
MNLTFLLLAGDGTTIVVLLAGEFLKEAKPFIEDGVHPQNLIKCFIHNSLLVSMTRPLLLVTASVDKMVLNKTISVDGDLKMGGSVVWVGRSSIEVQLGVTQISIDSTVITEIVALFCNIFHCIYGEKPTTPKGCTHENTTCRRATSVMKHSSSSTSTKVDIKSKPAKIKEPNPAGNHGSKGSSSKVPSEGENSVSKDKMSEDPENEKPKLLIRLTREEIEEDYLVMTGKKLPRNKMRRDYLVV